jgi:hypothetical protein
LSISRPYGSGFGFSAVDFGVLRLFSFPKPGIFLLFAHSKPRCHFEASFLAVANLLMNAASLSGLKFIMLAPVENKPKMAVITEKANSIAASAFFFFSSFLMAASCCSSAYVNILVS